AATRTPLPTAVASPTLPITASTSLTLTIWWPDALLPEGSEARAILESQLQAFEEANPHISIVLRVKQAQGKGGLLDLLEKAYPVAPSILPDLVVLNAEELGEAVRAGVLQPLDPFLPQPLLDDMYPFALNVGRFGDRLMALQFAADVEHLAYDSTKVPTPPVTWSDVLSSTVRYIFPAGGRQGRVNDAFLIQYLALGGRLVAENGQPALDTALLTKALDFYARGLESKVIRSGVLELETLDACWERLVAGGPGMANVAASRYWRERDDHPNIRFAPLPTWNGSVTTMSRGWVIGLVAQDQPHQEAAVQLLAWLLDPPRNAAWNVSAGYLPTRRGAITLLDQADPYVPFLHWQLESAHHHPTAASYDDIAQALQAAVREVLSGTATPEESAQRTLKALGLPTP
ncbi:MAG: extracellular solute-binding protein, partial [Anaerolineae bacterium]|nr:extracellular solute-binding protein [Anaerolineae bacterium]